MFDIHKMHLNHLIDSLQDQVASAIAAYAGSACNLRGPLDAAAQPRSG